MSQGGEQAPRTDWAIMGVLLAGLIVFAAIMVNAIAHIQPATAPGFRVSAGPPTPAASVSVVRVVDGDTIIVAVGDGNEETVRLIGVDAPEAGECYGPEASAYLRERVEGHQVTLTDDSTQADRDQYGRALRYVADETGALVNVELLKGGYAREHTYDTEYQQQWPFRQLELSAKDARAGLWGACPEETPVADQVP